MTDSEATLKDYYRDRIHNMRREANRLAIEVVLDAQDKDDVRSLAEAAEGLDSAVRILAGARRQLATA